MAKAISAGVFATRLHAALGGRLVSLLLYGSAARGTHVPGRSDVNTLLICDAVDEPLFAALGPVLRDWQNPPPLILTEAEWRQSADAFPIEYDDIRAAHHVLVGKDPWAGITVHRDDVRRALEQELKGKLVRLRQAYAATREDARALSRVVAGSLAGFFTMLRAAMRLAGRPAATAPVDLLAQAAAAIGFAAEPLADLAAHATGAVQLTLKAADPRAVAYLTAVARTAEFVDHL